MFKLNQIKFCDEGGRISYDYSVSAGISSYFNQKKSFYTLYDQDISETPLSLAVIPLLANIMPISWFVGFDVHIDEIDETFFESLKILKEQFIKFHPNKIYKGNYMLIKL